MVADVLQNAIDHKILPIKIKDFVEKSKKSSYTCELASI